MNSLMLFLVLSFSGHAMCVVLKGFDFPFKTLGSYEEDKLIDLNEEKKDTSEKEDDLGDSPKSFYSVLERALNFDDEKLADTDETQEINERESNRKKLKYQGCVRGAKKGLKNAKLRCAKRYNKDPLETNETKKDVESDLDAEERGVQIFEEWESSLMDVEDLDDDEPFEGLSEREITERKASEKRRWKRCNKRAYLAYLRARKTCSETFYKWQL